jgi:protein-L-isoaspartate(D-aspartate) O-methyltransferase
VDSTTLDPAELRRRMVEQQIRARGIRSPLVLRALEKVPRERFVSGDLGEFAYDDTALPIEAEQTISQPFLVASMIDALELRGGERVLEVGTGSGYAAAVLAEIAGEVWTVERHEGLARNAAERLADRRNVHVRHGDGTLGLPEQAPFDGIVVAAGGPIVPSSLRAQLLVGGRLVIPVGEDVGRQKLLRITRESEESYRTEELADVRFVPLVGAEGWHVAAPIARPSRVPVLAQRVTAAAEPFDRLEDVRLEPLLERIGAARVVLLGEATHGTSEFYRLRARITRALIERAGFRIVAVEADWPDAARIDHYVRDRDVPPGAWQAFARFPTWLWRNRETREFVDELREFNSGLPRDERVRFAGLDLYSLYTSIDAVLRHLDQADPEAARAARQRYGCLTPWQRDPAAYGHAALRGRYRSCEAEVAKVLEDLLARRIEAERQSDERWFETVQNARLVAGAEGYYRTMYYGSHRSWNLRDRHMFDTLQQLLQFAGPDARAVVWAHNSHVGNAAATEMAARGEWNIGQLCRQAYGGQAYSIGFGTDHGVVAAASYWGGPMERKQVLPSRARSYERLCHETALPGFLLPLRRAPDDPLRRELARSRLERAIGVIYRPETELASHYFDAVLPDQFDEWIWIDRTDAVQPLETHELRGMPDTYPFGL